MAVLIYKDTGGRYVDFQVPSRPFTIGRSPMADLQIEDSKISRVHCEISRDADGFFIKDLSSTNGTWLNNKKVDEGRLKFGDKIRLGHTIIAFDS